MVVKIVVAIFIIKEEVIIIPRGTVGVIAIPAGTFIIEETEVFSKLEVRIFIADLFRKEEISTLTTEYS